MRIIVFLLGFLISLPCIGQEFSPIQNYAPADYNAQNQNWDISQDDQKYLYFANNGGLLIFNGARWQLYPSPNGSIVRSVKAIQERVYTGCYMDFGYWERNNEQVLVYHSLTKSLDVNLIEDEQFWNIVAFNQWILFQSLDRIYIYNKENNTIQQLDSESTQAEIFVVERTIYFQKTGQGIFSIENGDAVLVSDDPIFKENTIVGAYSVNDGVLFLTEKGNFYVLNESVLTPRNMEAVDKMGAINVYSSLQLKDGSFILGTIAKGIFHITSSGQLIKHINQEKGLLNNTVLNLFEDKDQNIWLGLDNGISIINNNSPFQEYLDKNGNLGIVYTAILRNNYFYLGTNQGLFYRERTSEDPFQLIPNTKGQVWMLKELKGVLFCGHNRGTFVVNQGKAELISEFPGTWDIKQIESNSNLLLQGNYKGLSILERKNGSWNFRNKINGFDSSSRFIEFVEPERVIVNHEYKGIFTLELDTSFSKVLSMEEEAAKGIGASLVKYNGDVVYATNNGVFRYDRELDDFLIDDQLSASFFFDNEPVIGILTIDTIRNGLWGFSNKNIILVAPGKFSGAPEVQKIPIPDQFRSSMGTSGFEFITNLTNDQYIIGITNGYIVIDLNRLKNNEYRVNLTDVTWNYFDTSPTPIPIKQEQEFKYAQNNLNFRYCVPEYEKYLEVYYQYKLEGYFEDWSSWSNKPEVSFTNLPAGDYTFKVQAKIGNTLASNSSTYSFTIKRPWYASNAAIAFYLLLGGLLSFMIHQRYRKYYHRKHKMELLESKKKLKQKKLKADKEIAQVKNEKLQK